MLNVYDVIRSTGFLDSIGSEEKISEFVENLKKDESLQFVIRKQFLKWVREYWGYVSNIYSTDNDGQEWHFIIKKGTVTASVLCHDDEADAEEACIISLCLRSNLEHK